MVGASRCMFKEGGVLCSRHRMYAHPGQKAQFCSTHKQPDMVDVHNRRCKTQGCNTHPTFGEPGGRARFCKTHKLSTMVDVNGKHCLFDGCQKHPHYGNQGGKAQFCARHKQPSMVNVKHKRCISAGCKKLRTLEGPTKKSRFCQQHLDENRASKVFPPIEFARKLHEGLLKGNALVHSTEGQQTVAAASPGAGPAEGNTAAAFTAEVGSSPSPGLLLSPGSSPLGGLKGIWEEVLSTSPVSTEAGSVGSAGSMGSVGSTESVGSVGSVGLAGGGDVGREGVLYAPGTPFQCPVPPPPYVDIDGLPGGAAYDGLSDRSGDSWGADGAGGVVSGGSALSDGGIGDTISRALPPHGIYSGRGAVGDAGSGGARGGEAPGDSSEKWTGNWTSASGASPKVPVSGIGFTGASAVTFRQNYRVAEVTPEFIDGLVREDVASYGYLDFYPDFDPTLL